MGITAAAQLVGAGPAVRVGFKVANTARKAGQAVSRAATKVARAVSRSCSFVPGTLVTMGDGSRTPIEDVEAGNVVLAMDPLTGETSAQSVISPIVGTDTKWLYEIDLGQKGEPLIATFNHPFWVEGAGWTEARNIAAGDQFLSSLGTYATAVSVTDLGRFDRQTVYNLSVANVHTYFVAAGGNDVLVHNSACTLTSRAARRSAMRAAGIPTSMQPLKIYSSPYGRAFEYRVSGKRYAVVDGQKDVSHRGAPHWEAGSTSGRVDRTGRPRIQNNRGTPSAKKKAYYG